MNDKIAILGAGPMGLAVAFQLAREGYKPVIFEADDRIGGMAASFDFSGLSIERYYHFHCLNDDAFFKILKDLDISHELCWVETKMGYWFKNRVQPWGNPLALLKFNGLSLLDKLRYASHVFFSSKRSSLDDLEHLEATSWIKKWIGEKAYTILWSRLFEFKFYEYANNLSSAWICSRIRRIGKSRISIFKERLGYLQGGSETLLQAMYADIIKHGGEVRLRSPVSRVIIKDNEIQGVEYNNQINYFSKVISTIPIPFISKLIPDLPPDLIKMFESIQNIAVVCVIVKLKKQLTGNFWLNINDEEMDIPGLVEYTNLRRLNAHIVYVPFYIPNEHPKYSDSDEIFKSKVKKYLKKINPKLHENDFLDIKVNRYKHAQPICCPGFKGKLPPTALPIKGLWVADTSYYYPEDRGISESVDFGIKMAKMSTK